MGTAQKAGEFSSQQGVGAEGIVLVGRVYIKGCYTYRNEHEVRELGGESKDRRYIMTR